MTPLTAAQILTLRRKYIQDLVDRAATPHTLLSHYNRATGQQFVSDEALLEHQATAEENWGRTLDRIEEDAYATSGNASVAAASRTEALLGLIASLVITDQLRDGGFIGYLPEGSRTIVADSMKRAVTRYQTFTFKRRGGLSSKRLFRA